MLVCLRWNYSSVPLDAPVNVTLTTTPYEDCPVQSTLQGNLCRCNAGYHSTNLRTCGKIHSKLFGLSFIIISFQFDYQLNWPNTVEIQSLVLVHWEMKIVLHFTVELWNFTVVLVANVSLTQLFELIELVAVRIRKYFNDLLLH